MQRYFVEIENQNFKLSNEQVHQILHVMHTRINEELEFINNGKVYRVLLKTISPLSFELLDEYIPCSELKYDVTLLYCLPKGSKLDFVIQKATELGVKNIVLVESSRTVVKMSKEDDKVINKLKRYQKIAQEASEQCGRAFIPTIQFLNKFQDIDHFASEANYIAYENEKGLSLKQKLILPKKSISILIGAEGGFSYEEVSLANQKGFISVSLGSRILRSETAVIYALSLISSFLEEDS